MATGGLDSHSLLMNGRRALLNYLRIEYAWSILLAGRAGGHSEDGRLLPLMLGSALVAAVG